VTGLDDKLRGAADDLRTGTAQLEIKPFRPNRPAAPLAVAAAVLVMIIGVGMWALPKTIDNSGLTVTTSPDIDVPEPTETDTAPAPEPAVDPTQTPVADVSPTPQPTEPTASPVDPDPQPAPDPEQNQEPDDSEVETTEDPETEPPPESEPEPEPALDAQPEPEPATRDDTAPEPPSEPGPDTGNGEGTSPAPSGPSGGPPLVGRLSAAGAGDFYVPSPLVQAWSTDESKVILYRTGAASPGHVIVDTTSGNVITTVDLSPPDIEQVYWNPVNANEVIALEGSALVAFDITSFQRRIIREFPGCPNADAGVPSQPSLAGVLVFICDDGSVRSIVSFDIANDVAIRTPVSSGQKTALISPTGQWVVSSTEAGPLAVYDSALVVQDYELDRDGNVFAFVTTPDGAEHAAGPLFAVPSGSIVLSPLDGSPPQVIVGPDRGDEYPPGGNQIAAVGSRIVFSTRGPVEGELGGRLSFVDLARVGDELITSIRHDSTGSFDYWSNAFVSLSPSGNYAIYSTDFGTDRIDTWIVEFPS